MDDPVARIEAAGSLYERDFYAWTQKQAALLRERRPDGHDWANVAEEIESLGRSDRREIANRIGVLLQHLLKWQFQPGERSNSWVGSMVEQRRATAKLIRESPSLKTYPAEIVADAYEEAREDAARDTGLPLDAFPPHCPYTVEQMLDRQFLPGPADAASALTRNPLR